MAYLGNTIVNGNLKVVNSLSASSINGTQVNGNLIIQTENGSYVEGLRITKAPSGWATIVLGCNRGTINGAPSANSGWFIGDNTSNQFVLGNVDSSTGNASIWIDTNKKVTMNGACNVVGALTQNGTAVSLSNHTHSYLPLAGGTLTGAINTANNVWNKMGDDASIGDHNVGGKICIKTQTSTNTGIAFFNSGDTNVGQLEVNNNFAFNKTITATAPADENNSTTVPTTAWVTENANRFIRGNVTLFVSASGTGNGSSASAPMSIQALQRYLAVTKFESAANNLNGSYRLTIKFVPGSNYGTVTFEMNKIPGIRYITIDTSTGVASTTSNYSTNSPLFDNIYVVGTGLEVTIQNVEVNNSILSYNGSYVACGTYVGFGRMRAYNRGTIQINANTVLNVHNINTDVLFYAYDYGRMFINTSVITLNFRNFCYFTAAIFYSDTFGRMHVRYDYIKLTGTQPLVTCSYGGTLTGTSSTAAGTAAKAVTLASGQTFSLTTNAIAYVKFTANNTAANPTLNINGTGAKPIYWNGAAIPANFINTIIQYRFRYDGTHYVCENTFKRLQTFSQNTVNSINGTFSTTYQSGSWNWNGWHNWQGNGAIIGGVIYGSVSGYLPLSGGTLTGALTIHNSGAGIVWRAPANIQCTATANSHEWSFDLTPGSYTGTYWHVYSSKLGKTILQCFTDNCNVSVPNGTFTAVNVYNAVYNDYAEFFPRGEETEPGDVIALDLDSDKEQYVKSTANNRHHVVGVHSDDYAMIIGGDKGVEMKDNEVKYIPVSLMGRIKVKYIGAAKKGNYVVASEIRGVARAYDKNKDSELDIFGFLLEEDDKVNEVRRLKIKVKG